MKKKILLIGGKFTAKLVIEILDSNFEFVIFDQKLQKKWFQGDYTLVNDLKKINKKKISQYFLCIGDNFLRKQYANKFNKSNLKTINIISEDSEIKNLKKVGRGNLIYGNVYFDYFTSIGNYNYINCSSSILHDTKIGNYNFISPNVTINGNVRIGNNVFIGSSAVIGPGVTICDNVIIGANSFVREPIKKKGFYVGSPVLLKDR